MLNYERAAVYIPRPWLRLGPVDQCGLTNVYVHTYVPTRLVVVRFLKVLDVPVACALLASLKYAYSPCVLSSFLRCWCWLIFIFFFSSFPFSISIWTSFVFILSFSCGYYAVSSVSVSAATRLPYDILRSIYYQYIPGMYLDTYVRWSHLLIFNFNVWGGIRFVSVIVCTTRYLLFLFVSLLR